MLCLIIAALIFAGNVTDTQNSKSETKHRLKAIETQLDRIEENTAMTRNYWILAMFNWGWLSEPHSFITRLPEALYYYEKIKAAEEGAKCYLKP